MLLEVSDEIYEALKLRRPDGEQPPLLLDQAVLDPAAVGAVPARPSRPGSLGAERDGKRSRDPLAHAHEERALRRHAGQEGFGLLAAQVGVEPRLERKNQN